MFFFVEVRDKWVIFSVDGRVNFWKYLFNQARAFFST